MNTLNHLTDDQFAECALAEPIPAYAAHLAACPQCAAELETFSAAIQGFHTTARAWSEAQPRASLRGVQVARPSFVSHPALRWGFAAVLVVAAAVPVVLHGDRNSGNVSQAVTPSASADNTPEEIAEDNRLMERVQLALSAPDPSPLDEFGLSAERSVRRSALIVKN